MKLLKKINRGLIVTTVVLAAVVIYLVTLWIVQGKERPVVEETCQNYINTAVSYKMLPEKYRSETPDMKKEELDSYISSMTKDLKAFYTGNEQSFQHRIEQYKSDLESQAQGIGVVYKYQKNIKEFKDFTFDGDTVTVTILTDSVLDGPNIYVTGSPRENISAQTTDTITLQKEDDTWKVVYADLQPPMKAEQANGRVVYRTGF